MWRSFRIQRCGRRVKVSWGRYTQAPAPARTRATSRSVYMCSTKWWTSVKVKNMKRIKPVGVNTAAGDPLGVLAQSSLVRLYYGTCKTQRVPFSDIEVVVINETREVQCEYNEQIRSTNRQLRMSSASTAKSPRARRPCTAARWQMPQSAREFRRPD